MTIWPTTGGIKVKGVNTPVENSVYRMKNSKIQKIMRKDKENLIVDQCKKVEQNRITNSTKDLYQGVRNITKKFKPSNDTVKEEDGTILCDGEDIKKRWKEYCSKLYSCKKLWCCLVFNLFFLLIFLLVCCKQGLVAEAEAVLSFIIF